MSLSLTELESHCQTIIDLSQRKHGLIVLCEGNIHEIKGRIEQYRRLEILPDANFYKACVPSWWIGKRPTFIPCGDRKDVIDTFFKLRKLHFNQEKLFAIVDLDLQPYSLTDYVVADTEALFSTCYSNGKLQKTTLQQHKLFITGLIYKEAYFLVPDLQSLFDGYPTPVMFREQPLNLQALYRRMASALATDNNLNANFQRACARICYIENLNTTDISLLQESWLQAFDGAGSIEQDQLIQALLCIHQVKNYWQALEPKDSAIPLPRFQEQLALAIGSFYAQQPPDSNHHLPGFFAAMSAQNNNNL